MIARVLHLASAFLLILSLPTAANFVLFAPARKIDERMISIREDLAAAQKRIAVAPSTLEATTSVSPTDESLTIGGDPARVVARLQEQTRRYLSDLGGTTLSSQVVTTELSEGYRKISLLLRAQLTEQSLMSFLDQTETALPRVLVESLDVQILPVPADASPLDVTATLVTFHADDAAT